MVLMPTERLEADQYTRLILTVDSTFGPASRRIQGSIEIPIRISAAHFVDIVLGGTVDDSPRRVIWLA